MVEIQWADNQRVQMEGDYIEHAGMLLIVKKATTIVAFLNGDIIKYARIIS